MKAIVATLCAGLLLAGCSKDPTPSSAASQPAISPSTDGAVQAASAAAASATAAVAELPQPQTPQNVGTPTAVQPPSPPPPSHSYSYHDNGQYGYEEAISDEDAKSGIATKPLVMFRYIGIVDGHYIVESIGNNVTVARASCAAPCDFAKILTVNTYGGSNSQVMKLAPNSIIEEVFLDAMSGQLEPSLSPANYLFPASWSPPVPVAIPAPVPAVAAQPGASAQAVPSPAPQAAMQYQTSFDCLKARSDAEHLICGDPDLAAADRELSDIFERAKAAATDQAAFKERTRAEWNYRERNCHDKVCLTRWYADQKTALEHIAETGTQ